MQIIPLEAIPNQKFNIVLENQNCTIKVYQRGDYLFADLWVDNVLVREGMICLVDTSLLSYPVNGFAGVLYWVDMAGMGGTPNYAQLGSRYLLCYATQTELQEAAADV